MGGLLLMGLQGRLAEGDFYENFITLSLEKYVIAIALVTGSDLKPWIQPPYFVYATRDIALIGPKISTFQVYPPSIPFSRYKVHSRLKRALYALILASFNTTIGITCWYDQMSRSI
jgi:hypothetical protein